MKAERLHLHSFRVATRLRRHGYRQDVVLAGLLHDIVEDGGTTLKELRDLGFSTRTVRLVDLATHDPNDTDKNRRWVLLVEKLRHANDREAWALKVCDLIDNLNGCATLPMEERRRFFLDVKGPIFLRLSYPWLSRTSLYRELVDAFTRNAAERYRKILRGR